MFKFAGQPLSIAKLYGQGFNFYKSAFSKVWYLILINVAIIGIIQVFTYSAVPVDKVTTAAATAAATTAAEFTKPQTLIFGVANFIGFLIAAYFTAVIMYRMYILGEGAGASNLGDPFQAAVRKWFKLVVVEVIVLLLVMLGIISLVLPGIFLAILFIFAVPIVLFESKGIWTSLGGSCKLVWGNFWRSAIVLIPAGIILILGTFIQHFVFKFTNSILVTNLVSAAFFVIFGVITYSFLLVQYNDLRLRKQPPLQPQQSVQQ